MLSFNYSEIISLYVIGYQIFLYTRIKSRDLRYETYSTRATSPALLVAWYRCAVVLTELTERTILPIEFSKLYCCLFERMDYF